MPCAPARSEQRQNQGGRCGYRASPQYTYILPEHSVRLPRRSRGCRPGGVMPPDRVTRSRCPGAVMNRSFPAHRRLPLARVNFGPESGVRETCREALPSNNAARADFRTLRRCGHEPSDSDWDIA